MQSDSAVFSYTARSMNVVAGASVTRQW